MIEILKIFFSVPFLLYSCYSDLNSRRVSNKVWKYMLASGSGFVFYEILTDGLSYLMPLLLSGVLVFTAVYLLFQFGAFGGGDAKGLIVLSILFPSYPVFSFSEKIYPLLGVPQIGLFTFTVLGNALLMTILVPLGMFGYNLLHFSPEMIKNPLYMFIGYRTEISSLKYKKHLGLLEKFELDESGSLKKTFSRTGLNFDADQKPELEEYLKKGLIEKDIWVTPGLPFMLSITAGFITAVVFGDLIFYAVMRLIVN
ncbi:MULTISPECIES: A24 family peptidase C-terminal domain-containing protein [Methanosarcina]|uniref:Signal peptidase, type IV-prepilin/preflagellin n=4 Tax=Methanosarcina barkeri TaxID=2208 RepID=A0A0E3QSF7_METBA|nr:MULTISPECIES: A24 family peptidase C-terminal domain-containing protein [Methanosarcina]AKB53412.1 Signal peptidase, type IV - prepilin/preflagellin [Methanosarcina barkeri MS]AKB58484.1 Signal peptidase, type IV - prepilin/preflagellin [Methanosarcina barkeri 227]AKJ39274.1 archaeal peptidase A24 family [Methanosarcina barkeri CM1]OED09388.1 peptidase A24 [Methanosarcina sp. A14]